MYTRPCLFSSILDAFALTVEEVIPAVAHEQADTKEVVGRFEAASGDVALQWLSVCELEVATIERNG